jgi:chromosome segregation ATPase
LSNVEFFLARKKNSMNSSALLSVEVKQAFKSLNQHVRALVDLAQLHRIQPTASNNNIPAAIQSDNLIHQENNPNTNTVNPNNINQHQHQIDSLTLQLSRANADCDSLRLQNQVLSEQNRQKTDKLRLLLSALDETQARADRAERDAVDSRAQLDTARELLGEVRAAFVASTERLDEIDAERSRFTRLAAMLRQQNEQLRAHASRLEAHANYLAEQLEKLLKFGTDV